MPFALHAFFGCLLEASVASVLCTCRLDRPLGLSPSGEHLLFFQVLSLPTVDSEARPQPL